MISCRSEEIYWYFMLNHIFVEDIFLPPLLMQLGLRVNAIDLRLRRKGTPDSFWDILRIGFIVDLRCKEINSVLKTNPEFFTAHQIYALISETPFEKLLPLLQYQNGVRLDSDITILSPNGSFDCYKIENARNRDALMVIERNGQWTRSAMSDDFNGSLYKLSSRKNLRNITLDAVVYVSAKWARDR